MHIFLMHVFCECGCTLISYLIDISYSLFKDCICQKRISLFVVFLLFLVESQPSLLTPCFLCAGSTSLKRCVCIFSILAAVTIFVWGILYFCTFLSLQTIILFLSNNLILVRPSIRWLTTNFTPSNIHMHLMRERVRCSPI